MSCDNFTDASGYINILNAISQLLFIYHPSHVIIDDDMNTCFCRRTYNTAFYQTF